MNFIKRFTTTVSASLDNAVGKMENHDAIIEATIKQTKQAAAKTKARINTLGQQLQSYENQLTEAQTQQKVWSQRALKLADVDENKALECLSRRNQCKASIDNLTVRITQQQNLIKDVAENLKKLQTKLDDMSQKHNLMRSRQAVAEVNRAVLNANTNATVNETFERWESLVLENEIFETSDFDPLDAEFSKQENAGELLMQLAELKAKNNIEEESV